MDKVAGELWDGALLNIDKFETSVANKTSSALTTVSNKAIELEENAVRSSVKAW